MEEELSRLYYNPAEPVSFSGVAPLQRKLGEKYGKKAIQNWLQSQDTYTLHKPARRKFPRNRYVVFAINEVWQVDLNDMRGLSKYNDGVNYILTVIDVFSKRAFAKPLKNKTAAEVIKAFESIFSESNMRPKNIQSDKGTEFTAEDVQTKRYKLFYNKKS